MEPGSDQPVVKTMHPFVAAGVGVAFLLGVAFLVYAGWALVTRVPPEQAGEAYQATVWGIVGLILSGAAGARLTGGDNPFARIASAVGSLTNLMRR